MGAERPLTVAVPMVQVRIVWMLVPHGLVPVPMRVRFAVWPVVVVLVMFVVHMNMIVFKGFVFMLVVVPLGQVEPET